MRKLLRLVEVAKLLGLPTETPKQQRDARLTVRRMMRRLERRDGVKYLHRDTQGGWLYVSVAKLEELLPWEPGTLTGIRRDMSVVNGQIRALTKKTNGIGSRVRKLEKFRVATEAFVSALRDL